MGNVPNIPPEWTQPERWIWEKIVASSPADLKDYNPHSTDLPPHTDEGWGADRRLRSKFLETILTQKAFVDATPYGGVRIFGALIDDAPLNLEHARLKQPFRLEKSRILRDVKFGNVRVDGEISLEKCFVDGEVHLFEADIQGKIVLAGVTVTGKLNLVGAKIDSYLDMDGSTFEGDVPLNGATVGRGAFLRDGATFKGELNLDAATIGSNLDMTDSTFEGDVILVAAKIGAQLAMVGSSFEKRVTLNGATVTGGAFLHYGATFKGELNLGAATIGSYLKMDGSTFEGNVILNGITVGGSAHLRSGATFKGELNLEVAKIGGNLELTRSTFKGDVTLVGAKIGAQLAMVGSSFEKRVTLNGAIMAAGAFLSAGATFKGELDLAAAKIDTNLEMQGSIFEGPVDLTGCTVTGTFSLGISQDTSEGWKESASLSLRNTHVGVLQDWWRDENANAWPKKYSLEGFTYKRLGSIAVGKGANMLSRPLASYLQWLNRDTGSSPQPYEHLADRFREAGEPHKATDILYAARERRRRKLWSIVDEFGDPKRRDWERALSLWALKVIIGYGLGNRYFRVLWWVGGLTLVGALVLIFGGTHCLSPGPRMLFASLDQLLPIVTLDKAHDILIFGDLSAKPTVKAQPYWVLVYFYMHKLLGWVLGSFLIAGLGGLTQRN